ncbi:ankyrin repeat and SAM domain-containing protein 6-like [Papaver somniferum]|uniref:ankyrin repeat and SAM domain-containing protein 6-like n=1 Tax=Papaver somniferum TaxID=3469 RepID=UPI000E6FAF72|nr:ankyrin repeat and SAM domain-containing protein 6-like [Papaver somniferum]
MAELQQPEDQNNGVGNTNPIKTLVPGGAGGGSNQSENPLGLGTKRQRRPSVRLGDIGDQQDNNSNRRSSKQQWNASSTKFRQQQSSQKELVLPGKSSKTRPLLNLGNGSGSGGSGDFDNETIESEQNPNLDTPMTANRRGKSKRGGFLGGDGGRNKRVRTNWVIKEEEESPNHLLENTTPRRTNSGVETRPGTDGGLLVVKRPVRSTRDNSNNHGGNLELDVSSDDNWKCGTSSARDGGGRERGERMRCMSLEDGVQSVLNGLGLSRYAPIFEMHEVDEEVLPLLTLEDLKDMGINAVGSRRKLFCAIQKLAKGFS